MFVLMAMASAPCHLSAVFRSPTPLPPSQVLFGRAGWFEAQMWDLCSIFLISWTDVQTLLRRLAKPTKPWGFRIYFHHVSMLLYKNGKQSHMILQMQCHTCSAARVFRVITVGRNSWLIFEHIIVQAFFYYFWARRSRPQVLKDWKTYINTGLERLKKKQ